MILQKYQALGNDFLILDCINSEKNASLIQKSNFIEFVRKVSDRRKLGCDQFIVVENSQKADAKIVFYNSDGSKAEACGNGTVASGVYISGFLGKNEIIIETDSSLANITVDGNKATIELPVPKVVELSKMDVVELGDVIDVNFYRPESIIAVNVGNPHCVLLHHAVPSHWQSIGSQIENMTHIFPHKTNVEFVRKIGDNAFEVFVWERGVGRTFACGTGACAVAFAMAKQGVADGKKLIEIHMEGSKIYGNGKAITVQLLQNSILMTNHAFHEGKIEV